MNYLFVGEDEFSKDIKLQKIKQELDPSRLETFNFEIIYSRDLDLRTLQARLLLLPIKAKQRLILIKDAPSLNGSIKQYLPSFLKRPFPHVSLILDARHIDERDRFFNQISRFVKLVSFRQASQIDSFTLARQIMKACSETKSQARQGKARISLRLLRQLLSQRERPEKILGAIRYQLNKERLNFIDRKNKMKSLLNCDIDIKTGRLKPEFALERLLIRLCYF